jgi:hypothetical protein
MKIKVVVIDLELSARAKRRAAAALVPVVLLVGGAVAYASSLHVWADGDTLSAMDLNGNFTQLDMRVTTLESAKMQDEQALATLTASVSALQTSKSTDEQTIASQGSSIAKLQGVVGSIVKKGGDNGTATCDTYCAGTQWGPSGTCVGAFDTASGQFVACSALGSNPGNAQLTCYCTQFSF